MRIIRQPGRIDRVIAMGVERVRHDEPQQVPGAWDIASPEPK
jgi:hypothetical protein